MTIPGFDPSGGFNPGGYHNSPGQRTILKAFPVGLGIGLFLSILIVLFVVITGSYDLTGGIIGLAIHYLVMAVGTAVAAEQQATADQNQINPASRVQAAAIGAGFIIALLYWFTVILMGIIVDSSGGIVYFGASGTFCLIVADFLIAGALGAFFGGRVSNRYKHNDNNYLF